MERKREVDPAIGGGPPAKRLRVAVLPASIRLLWKGVLVVLFVIRLTERTDSNLQIGRQIEKRFDRVVGRRLEPLFGNIQQFFSSLQDFMQQLQTQLGPLLLEHRAKQGPGLDANKEQATGKGLMATNEGEGTSKSHRLCFIDRHRLRTPVYTKKNIAAESNAVIQIGMFDGDNEMITSGPFSNVRVEILALQGDFPYDRQGNWTEEEFDKYIARGQDGRSLVLGGACSVRLTDGKATLGDIHFREGSIRPPNRKFIVGARVYKREKTGVRVQECIMDPVPVLDIRNAPNEKCHPPKLDDKVYRLVEIARDGVYCKRLQEGGIITVQHFLEALNKDENKLSQVLQISKQHSAWGKMVEHARECRLPDNHDPDAEEEVARHQDTSAAGNLSDVGQPSSAVANHHANLSVLDYPVDYQDLAAIQGNQSVGQWHTCQTNLAGPSNSSNWQNVEYNDELGQILWALQTTNAVCPEPSPPLHHLTEHGAIGSAGVNIQSQDHVDPSQEGIFCTNFPYNQIDYHTDMAQPSNPQHDQGLNSTTLRGSGHSNNCQ